MKKRVFSVLLILCMLLPAFNGLSVIALDTGSAEESLPVTEEPIEITNAYNKIHFYFDTEAHATIDDAAELAAAFASVKNDYAAAVMTADGGDGANENVYITVQFASDYMETEKYKEYVEALASAETAEQRDLVKMRRNAYSKSYHQAIIDENLPILAEIPYTAVNAVDYSSFVTLTVPAAVLDTAVLTEIAENANILHISLTDGVETIVNAEVSPAATTTTYENTSWDDVLKCINAYGVVSAGTYTGDGIKIGIYETNHCDIEGVGTIDNDLDVDHVNFEDLKYSIDVREGDEGTPVHTTHATVVASVLAVLVPDAQIYFSKLRNTDHGIREGLAYFIEKGCDIVNCSFGVKQSQGYRFDYDGMYDYQIRANAIIVTVAAGNVNTENQGYILTPGYAYNAITVGGVSYSSAEGGWVHADGSCYITPDYVVKPNVSAPFAVDISNIGVVSGTSISAPIVASCIAMLKEKTAGTVQYWMHPQRMMSVLMSTANCTVGYEGSLTQYGADEKVGAGIVDLVRMLNSNLYVYTNNTSGEQGDIIIDKSVNLTAGQDIQIALAWLISNDLVSEIIYCTDYDVHIYNSSNYIVASSIETCGNVELIRYTALQTGTYRIVVKQYGSRSYTDYLALTYNC